MNAKRPLTMLVALALVASVFAAGPAAASDCMVTQSSQDSDVLDVDADANTIIGNAAVSAPVLSPGADAETDSYSTISDGNDVFGSNQDADVNCN